MQKMKKVLKFVIPVLFLIILGIALFLYSLAPDYNGEKKLIGLSDVAKVHFDNYGIPHIYAVTEKDAIRSLGYVHAQDRLWQMELLRRIGAGQLSEIFGKELVRTDKLFLSLGIDDYSTETVKSIDKESDYVQLAEAYLDGINQFIDEGPTPIEFYLTGAKKRHFELKDVYNTIGYMAFSFAMAQKTDPLLTDIKDKLGEAYLTDLPINIDPNSVLIPSYDLSKDSLGLKMAKSLSKSIEDLPLPQFEGSNSWVIAPEKTKNEKVILANDPHIGYSQPSVWYEAHLSTPTYEKYGYHLAGVPFPLLAHSRQTAYGITMFENDDIDFYYEENHPTDSTKYKTEEGWKNYSFNTRTIKVKGENNIKFTVKSSRHGSILNGLVDGISGSRPIAISWLYTKIDNKLLSALYGMSHAENIVTFKSHLPDLHAPGLNIMYGDADGNIAWWASAKLYKMPDSTNTKFILNGSDGKQEPTEYLDFSHNPQSENPPWHYVYSANNQPDSIAEMLYPGYYLPENRAKRIKELLDPKSDWDMEAIKKMITDVTSTVNPNILMNMTKHLDVEDLAPELVKELDEISQWDGSATLESVESTIYHRWIYIILKNTLQDELGTEQFTQLMGTHLAKRMIAPLLANETSVWWDDIETTGEKESQKDIVSRSFTEAISFLKQNLGNDMSKWTWGRVHTIEHPHPMSKVETLRSYFNVGPFPIEGTREVINNQSFAYDNTGKHKVLSGPSTRRIIDFSDIENSLSILPTGQSGNMFSDHYDDQARMFVNGEFRKMMMNKEEIESTAKSVLIFKPE